MGSPVSPSITNAKMEDVETKALASANQPTTCLVPVCRRHFTVLHQYAIEEFTNHINSLDPHIHKVHYRGGAEWPATILGHLPYSE